MAIRAVIFDRDGVLTHFDFAPVEALVAGVSGPRPFLEELWERWHVYYTTHALPRTLEDEAAYIARFWDEVSTSVGLDDALRQRLRDFDYRETIRPFPDARPALLAAKEKGLRVGVLSNFPLVGLEASLVSTGLNDLVDVSRAARVLGEPKPHPDAYQQMLDALGVAPSECLMVDDEEPCVAGARAVGVEAYRLDWRADDALLEDGVLPDLRAFARILSA